MKHLAIILLLSWVSTWAATWPNEPAGSVLVSDWGFNTTSGNGWVDAYGNTSIVSDGAAPASSPSVLQVTFPKGMTDGIGAAKLEYIYRDGGIDQYSAYWWKASNPFQNHPVLTKMIYITNAYGNGCPFFVGMTGPTPPYKFTVAVQGDDRLDNRHLGAPSTSTWGFESAPILQLNRWTLIEMYVRRSTTISSRDGILRVWIDGSLVINVAGLNTDDYGMFSGVKLAPVFGGVAGAVKNQTDYFWFDHIRISRPNGNISNPLYIPTGSLPSAQSGKAYSASISVTGGKAPYSWAISSGSLLPGLLLNKTTGGISGTPTTAGKCTFTMKVLDSNAPAAEVSKSFSIVASGTSGMVPFTISSRNLDFQAQTETFDITGRLLMGQTILKGLNQPYMELQEGKARRNVRLK